MLAVILYRLVDLYSILILVYVLMSWIPRGGSGWVEDIRSVLASICEPYLSIFRNIIPPLGMVDFSPVVAILVLQIIERAIIVIL